MEYNNIESPFSFDLGDDLLPLPSLSFTDNNIVHLPHQLPSIISPSDNSNNNNTTVSQNPKNGRRRKPPPKPSDDIGDENPNEQKQRKIIHRDVERQRRQEMSSLYTTLRSLLPSEYLKGKRSISDHMQETVKYIQHMQGRIQQLSDKRNKLKKLSEENLAVGMVETLNSSKRDSVVVRAVNGSGSIQVVLDTATQHRLPVSIILQALAVEGLEILSCISTKVNDRFIHTIESQVVVNSDGYYQSIDVSKLQHKLKNLEYFPLD